uniref:ANK_REP_REGION domain-containing protein n=1 Tax=Globodera pallida TaxID=36090 RepID=A0A183C9B9_GLOPA
MGQLVSSILPSSVVNFFSKIFSALTTFFVGAWKGLLLFYRHGFTTLRFFILVIDGNVEELSELIDSLSDDELERLLHMKCPSMDDDYQITALIIAVMYGHAEVVVLLLEKGANPQQAIRQRIGRTRRNVFPLLYAVVFRHLEVCRILINYGANVDLGIEDETPLMCACYINNDTLDIVILLVESRADIERVDAEGTTALMFASEAGRVDVVRYLLSKNARIHRRDRRGRTALDLATDAAIVDLLNSAVEEQMTPPRNFGHHDF